MEPLQKSCRHTALGGGDALTALVACLFGPRRLAKWHECDGDRLADPPGRTRRCRAHRSVECGKLWTRPLRQIRLPAARRRRSGLAPVLCRRRTEYLARFGAFLAGLGGRP